ncbi:MAG TPA: hypothetical protein VH951_08035 [Dehalococcoidia bacterium]
MYHLVLLSLVVAIAVLGWQLVLSAPRTLSMILPSNLMFGFGAVLLVLAAFNAFGEAFALQSPEAMLHSFVTVFVGLWFMFAASAGLRGSPTDDLMVKRVMGMVALMFVVIIAALYLNDPRVVAVMNLVLITGGFIATQSFLRRIRN